MKRLRRNAGGWPARTKTVFDATAHRRMNRALDRLSHAQAHVARTATFTDPAELLFDADTAAAYTLLEQAWIAVHVENEMAQAAAKTGR